MVAITGLSGRRHLLQISGLTTLEDVRKYVILQGRTLLSTPSREAENIAVSTGAYKYVPQKLAQAHSENFITRAIAR